MSTPLPPFFSAAAISFLPSSFLNVHPAVVIGNVVAPVFPLSETRIGVCLAMWGRRSASARKRLTRLVAPGGVGRGVWGVCVGGEVPGERGAEPDDHARGDDPAQDYPAATAVGDLSEP